MAKYMTLTNSRKIILSVIAAATFILVASGAVFAQNATDGSTSGNSSAGKNTIDRIQDMKDKRQDAMADKKEAMAEKFCEKLSELTEKFGQKVDEGANRFRERTELRAGSWEEKQSERDVKLAERRSQRDSNLEEHFEKLETRAQTEEQKKAAAGFEEAMREAIETRRDAVDQAIADFREGVRKILEKRATEKNSAAKAFESTKTSAFSKAQNSCSAGSDAKAIQSALHAELKVARDNFVSERQSMEKIRTDVQALITVRKQTFEQAMNNFKSAAEKARTELQSALGEDGVAQKDAE